MQYISEIHHRRSIRLKEYDYSSAGAYFVTTCTWQRECLFGEIVSVGAGSKPAQTPYIVLNDYGKQVDHTWHSLAQHNRGIVLDTFVIMPNHVHLILFIEDLERAGLEPAPTLSEIVRQFKTFSSKRINQQRNSPGCPVWQRNYYERVIRNEDELSRAREYIVNNPIKWALDKENPANIK